MTDDGPITNYELRRPTTPMKAVILAGGKGTRLAPYTTVYPKPMMPVGDIPILEVGIRQLCWAGFTDITLAVGHLAELIISYFGDGKRFGVRLTYAREDAPLGTAGPLATIPDLDSTFLVMNGDLLTTINYCDLLAFHRAHAPVATIATHERVVHVDYGVIETAASNRITGYTEKPNLPYRVSMGIYVLQPQAVALLEPGVPCDFPDLVHRMLDCGLPVMSFPFSGYWLDIGRLDDYHQAVDEFEQMREPLLRKPPR